MMAADSDSSSMIHEQITNDEQAQIKFTTCPSTVLVLGVSSIHPPSASASSMLLDQCCCSCCSFLYKNSCGMWYKNSCGGLQSVVSGYASSNGCVSHHDVLSGSGNGGSPPLLFSVFSDKNLDCCSAPGRRGRPQCSSHDTHRYTYTPVLTGYSSHTQIQHSSHRPP